MTAIIYFSVSKFKVFEKISENELNFMLWLSWIPMIYTIQNSIIRVKSLSNKSISQMMFLRNRVFYSAILAFLSCLTFMITYRLLLDRQAVRILVYYLIMQTFYFATIKLGHRVNEA